MNIEMIVAIAVGVGVALGMGLLAGFEKLLQWDNQRRLTGERARLQVARNEAIDNLIARDRAEELRRRRPASATGPVPATGAAPYWDGHGQRRATAPWEEPLPAPPSPRRAPYAERPYVRAGEF